MDNMQIPKPFKSWLDFYNSIKNTKEFNSLGCYGEIKYQQYDDNFVVTGIVTISKHELDALVLGELLPIVPPYSDAKEMLYEVSICQSENTKQKSKLVDMIISIMEIQTPNT
ncbi:hypothetical protein [Flavobacterium sp.]|jgi:hypothetical protein|uniref:hypothetical protein n=1 Tax=Flavobacterium sp. TaxID=239 RepID=UPI0037BE23A0